MVFFKKSVLISLSSSLLLIFLFCQACTTSQSTITQAPAFHFGESPCLEPAGQKSKLRSKLGRAVVKRSFPKDISNTNGTIMMAISIDRQGKVVYAEYMPELSTIVDQKVIMSCIEAMSKTTFAEDPQAPEYECGLWTIKLKEL